MNLDEQQKLAHFEQFFFWHRGRRVLFAQLLSRFLHGGKRRSILEYGCGPGGNISFLSRVGDVSGVDISSEALRLAEGKGFVRLDLLKAGQPLPYPSASFDVVTALDVLEHIADDNGAVCELYRVLKPGGLLLASVPAFQWLWSEHDEALLHFRRYTKREFRALLSGPFTTVYSTYFCIPGVFAHFVRKSRTLLLPRKRETKLTIESEYKLPPFVNRLLYHWLLCECFVIRILSLPFGSSVVIVARKPTG